MLFKLFSCSHSIIDDVTVVMPLYVMGKWLSSLLSEMVNAWDSCG